MKYLAAFTLMVSVSAFAHHGWSEYDSGSMLQLTGQIEDSGYSHPHGFVRLKTAEKSWLVVLAPPTRMENRGLSQEMIKPGRSVTVVGYPNRNKPEEMRAERIIVDSKTTELR
ncbi:DUF6152 family protein [Herbaspirillum sp. GCM10030257]|uniref:DUF6152 family protein n=1 Tax=Herbaspirillum sp. GCM10030257 TaxID=3273393 RepID=UPI00361CFD1C